MKPETLRTKKQKTTKQSLHLSHFFFCRSRRMRKTYSVSMANEQFVKVHCNNALPMNSIGVELWQHVGEPIRRWNGSHPSNNYHRGWRDWRDRMGKAWYCSNKWWFVFDPPSGTAKELHLFFLICWPFSRENGQSSLLICSFTKNSPVSPLPAYTSSPSHPGETSPPPTWGLDRHLRPSPKRQVHWRPFRVVRWHTKRNLSRKSNGCPKTHPWLLRTPPPNKK